MNKFIFFLLLLSVFLPAQATNYGINRQEQVNAQDDCVQRILKPCIEKCESNEDTNCVQLCKENTKNECRQAGE
ncbi:hypothetical protein [Legionella clemsonensis]|uniref:Cysteine rich repeat protein n=1 Tax=Legionella clemsonensis TaxID=1867846 RepID=A0A222P675_9GAMM|nr:hypothetical protein [Legionella clemsonensis]ASQ47332.1 hypothetical protein clem_14030 [Legionella clemsonensis]